MAEMSDKDGGGEANQGDGDATGSDVLQSMIDSEAWRERLRAAREQRNKVLAERADDPAASDPAKSRDASRATAFGNGATGAGVVRHVARSGGLQTVAGPVQYSTPDAAAKHSPPLSEGHGPATPEARLRAAIED